MDQLRHGVEQTLAAERLEGWRPTSEHVADLTALVGGAISFGEYLAKHRTRYPAASVPRRRRLAERRRPYLIPGTTVLRNNFGTDSASTLADLEFVATAGRIALWHKRIVNGDTTLDDVDAAMLHQHIFGDVYSWAGRYRVTDLRRGAVAFAWRSELRAGMNWVNWYARRLAGSPPESALAYEFARLYAEFNRLHPFREGNGRTGTLLLHTVAALHGRRLDLSVFTREEWIAASRDSMPFRRDGRANHRPFLPLFVRALG